MRVDYYHGGNSDSTSNAEWFTLDRTVLEPLEWPGNPAKAIDESGLGNYLFEVREKASGKLIYSRGFSSVFAEWKTTDEAQHANRTFSESLRFPSPAGPVDVIVKKRDEKDPGAGFHEVWKTTVDPKDKFVDRSRLASPGPLVTLQKMGDSATKVDLLVLGDGYTAEERGKVEQRCAALYGDAVCRIAIQRAPQRLQRVGPVSGGGRIGVSRPSSGIYRRSPLGASYDTFDSERYVLTIDNRTMRDVASSAPYEFIEILVNAKTYGGGGIFNQYATVAIDNAFSPYVGVHEFGHHFAGLADEYYTSDVSYLSNEKRTEPWEPNATALLDPANLKWKDLVEPGTPLPTPWPKEEFESMEAQIQKQRHQLRADGRPESEMEELFRKERGQEEELFSSEKYKGKVGAFEGANYEAKGYYRPELNCIMFTRYDKFCAVCRRAIERVIGMYT